MMIIGTEKLNALAVHIFWRVLLLWSSASAEMTQNEFHIHSQSHVHTFFHQNNEFSISISA